MANDQKLMLPGEDLCADYTQARESAKKLKQFKPETVICYHGGIVSGDALLQLERLL